MFFSISRQSLRNFSQSHAIGRLWLNLDQGWQPYHMDGLQVWAKGYADTLDLPQNIRQIVSQDQPRLEGNFCVIIYDPVQGSTAIRTDRTRSFPIFIHPDEITNLLPGERKVWTDGMIDINQGLDIVYHELDIIGDIDADTVDRDSVIDLIHQRLTSKTQQFLAHNRLPIKVFLSGGIDTLLVYSYLAAQTDRYELSRCLHIDHDRFWLCNHGTLRDNFWGYSQICHWSQPTLLTSGAPGDEFMLRSPVTIDLWLKWHGLHALDLLDQSAWQQSLHAQYFQRPKHREIFQRQSLPPDLDRPSMIWHLCNIVINDWQHWHLGETLTWTPLRDLDIFKWFLRLPIKQALGQMFNSDISRALIARNDPNLLDLVGTAKNTRNFMANLADFYDKMG